MWRECRVVRNRSLGTVAFCRSCNRSQARPMRGSGAASWDRRCGLPVGSSVHGILQARILEWVAISFFRGSSQFRDRTHVSWIYCIESGFFTHGVTGEAHQKVLAKTTFPIFFLRNISHGPLRVHSLLTLPTSSLLCAPGGCLGELPTGLPRSGFWLGSASGRLGGGEGGQGTSPPWWPWVGRIPSSKGPRPHPQLGCRLQVPGPAPSFSLTLGRSPPRPGAWSMWSPPSLTHTLFCFWFLQTRLTSPPCGCRLSSAGVGVSFLELL